MNYIIEKSLMSDLLYIKDDLEFIEQKLQSILPNSLLFDVRLILDELICNSVVHGNSENKKKHVKLFIEVCENYLKIEIKDEGEGFVYNREDYDPTSLSTGGRGLRIVDGLTDEFYVKDNRVIAIRYL
ncbi:ATP-binding protein [Clostridium sp. D2Q-14]|uniref:ATP-binding protein n=1 Tax=Anaeromonas gelatinilytica TaxID=2683194 RepID=UPI00193C68ED|nr:ATP-binding protein [Anaeromonas gelatinilytica]MBS4535819.1 ATP-binding protein [Anaeromonas gelatinilytica]